jgi:hydroxypyruvate isomerase
MNKEKNSAVLIARYLVLMPLVATLVFTACHEKKDTPLPSTKTEFVEEMVEGVDIPDVIINEVDTAIVVVEEVDIPDVVVE